MTRTLPLKKNCTDVKFSCERGKLNFFLIAFFPAFLISCSIFLSQAFSGSISQASPVTIEKFIPPSTILEPGQKAISSIIIRNNTSQEMKVWVGYSVRDSKSFWHDAPFTGPVHLLPGKNSPEISLSWDIPEDFSFASGWFTSRIAVWSAPPSSSKAIRLACIDRVRAFNVTHNMEERSFSLNGIIFRAISKINLPAGNRGRFLATAIKKKPSSDTLDIVVKKGSFNGGELSSDSNFSYGRYSADIRTCYPCSDSPVNSIYTKSITAFFLYNPETQNEITLEIFNDGSRRIWFTVFKNGRPSAPRIEKILSFDPSEEFHRYSIVYTENKVTFLVDETELAVFENKNGKSSIPADKQMKIYLNFWFPSWEEFHPLSPADTPPVDCRTSVRSLTATVFN